MQIDTDLPLKSRDVDINLSYLHLEGGHLKLSYSNLPLVNIYLRGKYLFVLLNSAILANMQYIQR
jgi:hypothetical protein